jgi:hypothetical protein
VITATLKPGKCLNFKSPFQVVRNKFGKDVQSSFLPFAFFAQIRPCERSADYWWKSPKRTQIDNHRLVYTKVWLSAASAGSSPRPGCCDAGDRSVGSRHSPRWPHAWI